jgi:hypothetical protein
MNPDAQVVLDTCVLVPVSLCDTVLRLAECGLYVPRWSSETRVELERALVTKILKLSQSSFVCQIEGSCRWDHASQTAEPLFEQARGLWEAPQAAPSRWWESLGKVLAAQ